MMPYLLLHPHLARSAAAGRIVLAAVRTISAVLGRKSVLWRADLDMAVGLIPAGASDTSPGTAHTIVFGQADLFARDPGSARAEEAWLVLITITNTGLVPVLDEDYSVPLTFVFPGRKVIDARAQPGSPAGNVATAPVVDVETSISQECVRFGEGFRLNRGSKATLMVVLTGMPADPPIRQRGALSRGRITP